MIKPKPIDFFSDRDVSRSGGTKDRSSGTKSRSSGTKSRSSGGTKNRI